MELRHTELHPHGRKSAIIKQQKQTESANAMLDHSTDLQELLAANIAQVRSRIREATERAGRQPDEVTLVAVSKTKPVEMVELAFRLGVTDFGENRVQEALPKLAAFHPQGVRWHMIGHLQSNKAGKVVGAFDCVQSVDSLQLARLLNRHATQHNIRLPVLLEVNVSGEESKEGMAPDELRTQARQIVALPHL